MMIYRGSKMPTQSAFIVNEYFNRQMLSKIGYRYKDEDLEVWEVESFNLIASTLAEEEEKELKKNTRK